MASGFNKVEHGKYEKRLFQCKGKHTCRVEQVRTHIGEHSYRNTFMAVFH